MNSSRIAFVHSILIAILFGGNCIDVLAATNALSWQSNNTYRFRKLDVPDSITAGFSQLTNAEIGIHWTNTLSYAKASERQNLMNGGGVALGDFDGDGWCDIYLCNKEGPNALYRNLGGWKFQEITHSAGVSCTNQLSSGAVFADLNGDGFLDLLVTSLAGPNSCFLNLGGKSFTNITERSGVSSTAGSTSMALGDIDGDGDLDLYIAQFGAVAILRDGAKFSTRVVNGQTVVMGRYAHRLKVLDGKLIEFGEPDLLLRNDGAGNFKSVIWKETFYHEDGNPSPPLMDFGLAVQMRDINADGHTDIYVCNDFQTPDRCWINTGNGTFRPLPTLALRKMSYASMGVDFADLDRDGNLDFFTVEMLSRDHSRHLRQMSPMNPAPRIPGIVSDREDAARNALFWNRGDNTYAEIAFMSGLAATDWSWTPIFMDVDLDGYEDLLVTNGHLHDVNDRDAANKANSPSTSAGARHTLRNYPAIDSPNAAFRNEGKLEFRDSSAAWKFNSRRISHGMALADLDNDGDQDIVVNCLNAPPLIYRNDSSAPRVSIRLKGTSPNTQGIGAKVTLFGGAVTKQTQEILSGGRYLSSDDPIRVFASGTNPTNLTLEVVWKNGKRSLLQGIKPNYHYEINENSATLTPSDLPQTNSTPLFQDVSQTLSHRHHEEFWDDFSIQPLLPKKLSQPGPGILWEDIDGDEQDDLIIGSGKGSTLAIYKNSAGGKFQAISPSTVSGPQLQDQTSLVSHWSMDGKFALLTGFANYESPPTNAHAVTKMTFDNGIPKDSTPLSLNIAGAGPMTVADVDGDGDLDCFVGGYSIPGHYPGSSKSCLLLNNGSELIPNEKMSLEFSSIGLIASAMFSDLDGNGFPDLILACEWGAIRLFLNDSGQFRDATKEFGMDEFVGMWRSVATGDFNGDGRLDIVAGNWGLNSFHNRAPQGPWSLYYGDLNADGRTQIVEAYFNREINKVVPWRDMALLSSSMPWIIEQFRTHEVFARASVEEILGDRVSRAKRLEVNTLHSMLFLNQGNRFIPSPLPSGAQWTPIAGLAVADFNADGDEDLYVSQNYFAVRTEDSRFDAGRGLLLSGNGKGQFSPMEGHTSGIRIYGEQRGCAVSDFDRDGRVDLAVTQNGAETKLYRNMNAATGVRIRLQGSKGNPRGIGATIRLKTASGSGPAREIQAGSGYLSQNSPTQILKPTAFPCEIWIRWPGGKTTSSSLQEGSREVLINNAGVLQVIR